MNIMMITARADHGGGPRHIYNLLKYNNTASQVSYYVACPKEKPYWALYERMVGADRMLQIPHRKFEVGSLIAIIRFIRKHKIDIIHAHGKGAGVYGKLASLIGRVPCVYTIHGIHIEQYNRVAKALYLAYEQSTAPLIDHIIFVSPSEKRFAEQLGLWKKNVSSVIPNGVENISDQQIKMWRQEMRQRMGWPGRCGYVATITRFDFQKNMDEAFAIARVAPDFQFVWIGDGESRRKLELKAKIEQVSNISFMGFVPNPLEYLAACDLYLSVSRWEGMPYGILEAMSVGLPIVASNVTGNVDVVFPGKNGFLYPLGQPQQACSYITKICSDVDCYQELSRNSINLQRQLFSLEEMARKTVSVYNEVMVYD